MMKMRTMMTMIRNNKSRGHIANIVVDKADKCRRPGHGGRL